jgi:hypothetical protein
MKAAIITGISPLLRKSNHNSDKVKVKLYHFIVLSTNDQHAANKCITNDCYIKYLYHAAERFNRQRQITSASSAMNTVTKRQIASDTRDVRNVVKSTTPGNAKVA